MLQPATPLSVPDQQRQTPLRPLPNDQLSPDSASSLSSSYSTPSSSERPQIPTIPRPPAPNASSENRRRCLEPLNLGSSLHAGLLDERRAANLIDNHFIARIEAFFENQQKFNERLEKRVTEHLKNERENASKQPTPMKRRLPKELSVSCVHVLF